MSAIDRTLADANMKPDELGKALQRTILRINTMLAPGGFDKEAERDWIVTSLLLAQVIHETREEEQ